VDYRTRLAEPTLLCALAQDATGGFRLIIERPTTTSVFSGDFAPGTLTANPLSQLKRTFVGNLVPLEVYQVNSSALSPQALCEKLQKYNPGACCTVPTLCCGRLPCQRDLCCTVIEPRGADAWHALEYEYEKLQC
jgi:hypothetical protein